MANHKLTVAVDLSMISDDVGWYPVLTQINYEENFARNLIAAARNAADTFGAQIDQVFIPVSVTRPTPGGRLSKTLGPWATYVFVHCRMSEELWSFIRRTSGATMIISSGNQPKPIDDEQMDRVLASCDFTGLTDDEREHVLRERRVQFTVHPDPADIAAEEEYARRARRVAADKRRRGAADRRLAADQAERAHLARAMEEAMTSPKKPVAMVHPSAPAPAPTPAKPDRAMGHDLLVVVGEDARHLKLRLPAKHLSERDLIGRVETLDEVLVKLPGDRVPTWMLNQAGRHSVPPEERTQLARDRTAHLPWMRLAARTHGQATATQRRLAQAHLYRHRPPGSPKPVQRWFGQGVPWPDDPVVRAPSEAVVKAQAADAQALADVERGDWAPTSTAAKAAQARRRSAVDRFNARFDKKSKKS